VFHLFASLAQYERALVRERVVAGLEAARRRGRRGGRPRRLDAERVAAAKAMLAEGKSLSAVARVTGMPRSTLADALRRAGA
jgi:DNA invertase Pin-like site-specific DNA recombinase